MWCVKEVSDAPAEEATIALDPSEFGQGFSSKHSIGQQEVGFSFFESGEYQRQRLR